MDRMTAMETFVRVVEAGSFSRAARHLRVGQPAVSKTVAQLEDRLGVRLLVRSTRGLATTEAGQAYYERAKRAIEEADEAELSARGAGSGLTGRLRVCAAVTFASLHIIPLLPEFLDAHPDLDLEVVLDDRAIDLVHEGIDVAFRMGTLAESALTVRRIGRAPRLVVGTPDYFARFGTPRTPGDLAGHQAVVYGRQGDAAAWTFRRDDDEAAVAVRSRLKVTAAEGVRAAVLAGLGLAAASRWMFAPDLDSGRVQAVLTDWALPPVDLWAVFPAGRTATAKARALVAFIETRLPGLRG